MLSSRRAFLEIGASAGLLGIAGWPAVRAQSNMGPREYVVQTPVLDVGIEEHGGTDGVPVFLLHGFPDDVRAWDEVATHLADEGCRVIVPYLRGYGATRFRDPSNRMGQQAALAQDLIDLADALDIPRFALSGYDWGGRAACIVSALHPDRVSIAVLIGGYTIQNTLAAPQPAPPEREAALWYQWYLHTERGRVGLENNRRAICRYLWQTWSPTWRFSEETFSRTAPSFDNPDFVDVVVHSYRHRHGEAPGEPRFTGIERQLAERPTIEVPVAVLHGADDAVRPSPPEPNAERLLFPNLVIRGVVSGAGHFLPRENPEVVTAAMLDMLSEYA